MTLQKQDVDPTLELLAIFCMPQLSQGPISHNQHLCYLNSLANGAKPIIKQQSIYCAISGEPPISVWSLMATLANTLCKDIQTLFGEEISSLSAQQLVISSKSMGAQLPGSLDGNPLLLC
jgi:hypothetical protein